MTKLDIGSVAPNFSLLNEKKEIISLESYKGKHVILYFYPKDNTPGCTTEAIEFSRILSDFKQLDAEVIGISPDSPESHAKFIEKHDLKVTLLSDPDHSIIESYDAWGKIEYQGKEYEAVERSTFLIDPDGKVAHIWPKVDVKGHANACKVELKRLKE